ncbi:MAG: L-threonylcarbamoyladenylate synthase, partial [Bacteroidota bacterium]
MKAKIGTDITEAQRLLEAGEVVAIPTETVYGLAGNGFNLKAISEIFAVKNRPKFDPLILHTDSLEKLKAWVDEFPPLAQQLAEVFWPGPLTLVLPKTNQIPELVTSGLPDVAFRIPAHSLTRELLSRLDFPLAAPSANPFGFVSPTTPTHVHTQLGDKIPYILDGGACPVGLESTIIAFPDGKPKILRLGGLALEEIEKVIGKVEVQNHSSSNPAAPGMLKSHYSPRQPLILGDLNELLDHYKGQNVGVLSFRERDFPENVSISLTLSPS